MKTVGKIFKSLQVRVENLQDWNRPHESDSDNPLISAYTHKL